MRSGIPYAALLTAVSASAADYTDRLTARDHVAEYLADLIARSNLDAQPSYTDESLFARNYDDGYYHDDLMARDYDGQTYEAAELAARDAELEMLYARHPEAEPILGLNTIGKWVGQAAGSIKGGFRSRQYGKDGKYANQNMNMGMGMREGGGGSGGFRGDSLENSGMGGGMGGMGSMAGEMRRRSIDDYDDVEEIFLARDADAEAYSDSLFGYEDQHTAYRRSIDDLDLEEAYFYAREAEAEAEAAPEPEPEPVLGLNHIGKWAGQAVGSVAGGYKSRANGKHSGYETQYAPRGNQVPQQDLLMARDAEAEPILGLNTVGKWVGQAVGSVAGGFKSRSGPKGGKEGKEGKKNKGGGGGGQMGGGGMAYEGGGMGGAQGAYM